MPGKKPLISVLMPFYDDGNGAKREYCGQAIDSILNQTFKDFELVFVVSGRKDFARRMAKKSGKIRLFFFKQKMRADGPTPAEKAAGIVKARNLCLRNAGGDYVAWADADDISYNKRLETQYAFVRANAGIGVLGSAMTMINSNGKVIGRNGAFETHEEIMDHVLGQIPVYQPTVMVQKKLYDAIGGYSTEELSEDYNVWIKLLAITRFHNIQQPLVKYRFGTGTWWKWRADYVISGLKIRLKAEKLLGKRMTLRDIAINAVQIASVFYPNWLGKWPYLAFKKLFILVFPDYAALSSIDGWIIWN